eukprot:CAMPEP_0183339386 /NCGR_PEP_ID=MMETSP0164_2-20130417/6330_1 /TAXON_ID=221442 /ORGANISM="Coccolithus pelagicus ssp braarudi, Strain PLY182g" /LENGTH=53 /DNA_ID=CAMNT_0025509367 /DNA_START=71 /DNA_END=232 /DNA_ORIENTATION=-
MSTTPSGSATRGTDALIDPHWLIDSCPRPRLDIQDEDDEDDQDEGEGEDKCVP